MKDLKGSLAMLWQHELFKSFQASQTFWPEFVKIPGTTWTSCLMTSWWCFWLETCLLKYCRTEVVLLGNVGTSFDIDCISDDVTDGVTLDDVTDGVTGPKFPLWRLPWGHCRESPSAWPTSTIWWVLGLKLQTGSFHLLIFLNVKGRPFLKFGDPLKGHNP